MSSTQKKKTQAKVPQPAPVPVKLATPATPATTSQKQSTPATKRLPSAPSSCTTSPAQSATLAEASQKQNSLARQAQSAEPSISAAVNGSSSQNIAPVKSPSHPSPLTPATSANSFKGGSEPVKSSNGSNKRIAQPMTKGKPNFGNGLLNLVEAYEFNEEQILGFLHQVSAERTDEAKAVAEGILTFILTENNDKKRKLESGERVSPEEVRELSEAQLKGPQRLDDTPSIPISQSVLRQQGRPLPESEVGRMLQFDGVDLPMITIYDYLAWLLSILGSSESKEIRTAENYYLPLLALFSRWCTMIGSLINFDALPMVHISWWEEKVLLGATLGDVPEVSGVPQWKTRNEIYIQPRETILTQMGFKMPGQVGKTQNFGRCAETFLFIVAKTREKEQRSLQEAEVKGFAMVPNYTQELPQKILNKAAAKNYDKEKSNTYEELQQARAATYGEIPKYRPADLRLADPCSQSCQTLFPQLGWKWEAEFAAQSKWQAALGTDPNKKEAAEPKPISAAKKAKGDAVTPSQKGGKAPARKTNGEPPDLSLKGSKAPARKTDGRTKNSSSKSGKAPAKESIEDVKRSFPKDVKGDGIGEGPDGNGPRGLNPAEMLYGTAQVLGKPLVGATMKGIMEKGIIREKKQVRKQTYPFVTTEPV